MTRSALLLIERLASRNPGTVQRSQNVYRPWRRLDLVCKLFKSIGVPDVYTGGESAKRLVKGGAEPECLSDISLEDGVGVCRVMEIGDLTKAPKVWK